MKPHTRIWFKSRRKKPGEPILCEWCRRENAVDVHHLDPRKMGGSKLKDYPENVMALCRTCHADAEAHRLPADDLKQRVTAILGTNK